MSTTAPIHLDSFQPPPLPVRRFTVDEYHRMGEVGVLTEDDRVELLEGWIVPKMNRSARHDGCLHQTLAVLNTRLPSGWHLRIQAAITSSDSEPEPDLAIVIGEPRKYLVRHPSPNDVALAVEVADSSLAQDRVVKARLYARAGIPSYWIINLIESQIEVLSDPTGPDPAPSYRQQTVYRDGESVPLVIGGSSIGAIAVRDLLP